MRKYIQTRITIEVTVHDRKTISSKMRPTTILPDDMLIGRDMICGEERSWRDFVHWKEAALAGPRSPSMVDTIDTPALKACIKARGPFKCASVRIKSSSDVCSWMLVLAFELVLKLRSHKLGINSLSKV
jgi:hypothetical protein